MSEFVVGFYVCLVIDRDNVDQALDDATQDLKDVLNSEGFTPRVAGIQPLHSILVPVEEVSE
jgi:hypothetical protein